MSNQTQQQDQQTQDVVKIKSTINGTVVSTEVDNVLCSLTLGEDFQPKGISYNWTGQLLTSIDSVNAVVCDRFAEVLKEFDEYNIETIQKLFKLTE